jgi:hypothetical protein
VTLPNFPNKFLASTERIVDGSGRLLPIFFELIKALWNRTGSGSGVPASVATGIAAAGTTQATATALGTNDWNSVDSGATNSGVQLVSLQVGQSQTVFNNTGNTIKVYPQSGQSIDAGAANAAYSLTNGKQQTFQQWTTTQVRSTQLG